MGQDRGNPFSMSCSIHLHLRYTMMNLDNVLQFQQLIQQTFIVVV
jgi:hypothetical protein